MASTNKWTYWHIYVQYGLCGSYINLVYQNPLMIAIELLSLSINVVTIFAYKLLTDAIYASSPQRYYLSLLIFILLSRDITNFIKLLCKSRIQVYKNNTFTRILTAVDTHIKNAPIEIHNKYSASDLYDALQRFLWVHHNTTQMIITTTVSVIRSIIISMFVVWNNIPVDVFLI